MFRMHIRFPKPTPAFARQTAERGEIGPAPFNRCCLLQVAVDCPVLLKLHPRFEKRKAPPRFGYVLR